MPADQQLKREPARARRHRTPAFIHLASIAGNVGVLCILEGNCRSLREGEFVAETEGRAVVRASVPVRSRARLYRNRNRDRNRFRNRSLHAIRTDGDCDCECDTDPDVLNMSQGFPEQRLIPLRGIQ